jgi:Spy/CpxP family protein refolding chaperone
MARPVLCVVPLLVLLATPELAFADGPAPARQERNRGGSSSHDNQPRDRWKWWLYDRAELQISDKQSADIDRLFETSIGPQRERRAELERLESALDQMVKEAKAEVATVAQQVEKVENLRAEMNKARMVLLYRINLLLTPEQRFKVERLRARRDAERGKDGRRHP